MALKTRTYTTPAEPARERTVTEALICDLCGRESSDKSYYHGDWGHRDAEYNRDIVRVEREYGNITSYGGWSGDNGGSTMTERFDICPSCWETVKAWFAMHGATPRVEEQEYD